jgi:hypothetical protein
MITFAVWRWNNAKGGMRFAFPPYGLRADFFLKGKIMAKSKVKGFCVYCGVNPATEREDVFAKQFFPPEHQYRGNLVKVPACGICNRKKQEAEDSPGIFFQFSDATPASEAVLEKRALRTFKKNERLRRAFQQGLDWYWVRLETRKWIGCQTLSNKVFTARVVLY